jgi:hypothetical protein
MEPAPEPTPQGKKGKLTFRAVFSGIIIALIAETLFILLAKELDKRDSDDGYLAQSKLWWLATGLLSFFLGRYVTSKISGVKLKSIFKWDWHKD